MPPLPIANKCQKITLKFTIGEDLGGQTSFYINYTGVTPTLSAIQTFASAIFSTLVSDLLPLFGVDVTFTECEVIDLTSDMGPVGIYNSTATGSRDGAGLPADSALVEAKVIARRYRGGHPRQYWPAGIQSDLQDPQTWTAAFLSAAESALAAFYGEVVGEPWVGAGAVNLVNVSYFHGFTPYQNPITGRWRNVPNVRSTPIIDTVTGSLVRTYVGSQRRRQEPR
jgi:hypothetical protein